MKPGAPHEETLWTRTDWVLVLVLVIVLTLGVFLGSMAAFYVQWWVLLRGLP